MAYSKTKGKNRKKESEANGDASMGVHHQTQHELPPDDEDAAPVAAPVLIMEELDVEALVDRCLAVLLQHDVSCHCDDPSSNNTYPNQDRFKNDCRQVFIAIGGTPGSGKSYIADQVSKAIAKRNPNGHPDTHECVVIGMDGYHLTRQKLKELAEQGHPFKTDQEKEDGTLVYKSMTYEELMSRRGASFTYDPQSFIRDLKQVKRDGEGVFPQYDRVIHDPIPDGVQVKRHHKIILVEGLYLLCLHDPDWAPLEELWDDTWFIEVSKQETKRRLIARHLKHWNDEKTKHWGGDDEAAAKRKAESNDLKNAECIRKFSYGRAKLIIKNEKIPKNHSNNVDAELAGT